MPNYRRHYISNAPVFITDTDIWGQDIWGQSKNYLFSTHNHHNLITHPTQTKLINTVIRNPKHPPTSTHQNTISVISKQYIHS